jgi:hypothetical protein
MGYCKKIVLVITVIVFIAACNKIEPACEEIILYAYTVSFGNPVSENNPPEGFQINWISQDKSYFKKINFSGAAYSCYDTIDKYPDTTIYKIVDRAWKIELNKDTLNGFFMPIGGLYMDNNSEVGSIIYHSCVSDEASEKEKLQDGILLESKIFDTIFNTVHVRQCNHYSLFAEAPMRDYLLQFHFYYDIDRCLFIQVEMRNAETNKLLYLSKVVKYRKISSFDFGKFWNSTIKTDSILMPHMCPSYFFL